MIPLVARGIASLAGRMTTRNPQLGKNLLNLFNKDKGITLYRGETARLLDTPSKASMAKMFDKTTLPYPGLRKQAMGRWFTSDPKFARGYAGVPRFSFLKTPYKPGYIQKLTLSDKEAKLANRLANRLHKIKDTTKGYGDFYVVPKKAMKRVKKDKLQTFINNMYKMIGKYKNGGLAQILNI